MEEIWKKFGRNLEGIWKKFGRNLEGIWKEFGRNLEGIWKKFGRNLEEMWKKFGRNLEEMWKKFRRNKMEEDYDKLYKIVLVGDSNVGKSNILSQFTQNEFNIESRSTIGVEFATKSVYLDDKIIKAQIWDTAGQERYRAITSAYYRGAHGALIIYDITSKNSFNHIENWYNELKEYNENITAILLIGNKSDLTNQRQVSTDELKILAQKYELLGLETSALNGHGIDDAFMNLIQQIHHKQKILSDLDSPSICPNTSEIIQIRDNPSHKQKTCCH